MPLVSATLRQSETQVLATIHRQCDRLARIARQIDGGSHRLPALLGDIEHKRHALLARARIELAGRAETVAPYPTGPIYWCARCEEQGSAPICAFCARPAVRCAA